MFSRIDHLGFCVENLDGAVALWRDLFGAKEIQRFSFPLGEKVSASCVALRLEEIHIVIAMQVGDEGPLSAWIEQHGSGLHHIGFAVEDIDESILRCRNWGLGFLTKEKVEDENLSQIMSGPDPSTGISYELIHRKGNAVGFALQNAKQLMSDDTKYGERKE